MTDSAGANGGGADKKLTDRLKDFVNYRLPQHIRAKALPSQLGAPIASFTFDDFPKSALITGGRLLEQYGAVGTYYVAGSLCNTSDDGLDYCDESDIVDLCRRGHELGSHGFSHWRSTYHRSHDLLIDIERNQRFLRGISKDIIPCSFAYPYGETSLRTKRLFARRFSNCRGTTFGLNHGMLDLGQLRVISLEREVIGSYRLDRIIADAVARRSWIIFYTHDISDAPTRFGSTPAMLEQAISACRSAGIDILPMKNALARACFAHDS